MPGSDFKLRIDLDDLEITLKKIVAQYSNLQQSLANKNRILEIQTELNIASSIQKAYLPNNFTRYSDNEFLKSDKISLYGEMLPAKEVGGDEVLRSAADQIAPIGIEFSAMGPLRVSREPKETAGRSVSALACC